MTIKILLAAACLGAVLLDAAKKLDLLSRWHMALCALFLPHALFWWQRLSLLGGPGLWAVRLPVCAYFIWTLLRLLFFPARDYQTDSRRVRVLWDGRMALRGGLLLLLMQAVFYLWVLPPLADGLPGWVVPADLAAALLLAALVILGGALRILFTCRRLGVVKRTLLVLNLWIPVVNLFLMLWLCRAARDEYDHECYREEARRVRAERDICRTKYPLLLVHGIGFRDLKYFNYWGRIPRELQRNGAAVHYGHQQAWGTIEDNAAAIREKILEIQRETGCEKVNIIAHSKGGLDARCLITRLGMGEAVASLTTISTPHRGSELLDLLGKLPDGLYRKICGMVDAAFRRVGDVRRPARQLPELRHRHEKSAERPAAQHPLFPAPVRAGPQRRPRVYRLCQVGGVRRGTLQPSPPRHFARRHHRPQAGGLPGLRRHRMVRRACVPPARRRVLIPEATEERAREPDADLPCIIF